MTRLWSAIDQWEAVRAKAPSRPRPHTLPHPAVLGAASPVLAPIDRFRDRVAGRRRPTRTPGP